MAKNTSLASLKAIASSAIDGKIDELFHLSDELHKNPELANEEFKAHQLFTDYLEKEGFAVERSCIGIKTSFKATFGSGKPNVCVISEYDALPGIGHACGHNLIAEAGVAAGLALKAVLESSDAPEGTVTVMGTPAEEAYAGKVFMIERGAFEGVDFAMMVHPYTENIVKCGMIAVKQVIVTYTGKAAHAAAFPWEGVNALDAAVMAYTSISALRQQMKPTWRVHGVITNGGAKPNIIPEKSEMIYYIRAPTKDDLEVIGEKIEKCFQAAAVATGCEVVLSEPAPAYLNVISNPQLSDLYFNNSIELGVPDLEMDGAVMASTDMGNVSHIIPSIHPMYKIGNGEVNHTREFTAVANTPEAHRATLTVAKAMAHTAIDVLTTPGLMDKIKKNFNV